MSETVECVVVGAGVVGLAIARALALQGREVVVIEAEGAIGTATSSRNSEVIHAGLYYPTGSLKARACLAGREALYAYCAERGIGHARCGKLVVATREDERDYLERLEAKAHANGVTDVRLVGREEVREREPAIEAVAALESPSTGIIDSHELMLNYQGDAEANGAMIAFHAPLAAGGTDGERIRLEVGGDEPMELSAGLVVNTAGLGAWDAARAIAGLDHGAIPPRYMARGVYFTLTGRAPFRHLIYPVPEPGGLGTHVTLDLGGQAKFGPDVEWVEEVDYTVDPARAPLFEAAIRRYWPGLPEGALVPGYAGIRPKVTGPGEPAGDFVIQGPETTGHPAMIALYGIESPGLTASLALADLVARLAERERV